MRSRSLYHCRTKLDAPPWGRGISAEEVAHPATGPAMADCGRDLEEPHLESTGRAFHGLRTRSRQVNDYKQQGSEEIGAASLLHAATRTIHAPRLSIPRVDYASLIRPTISAKGRPISCS